MPAQGLTRSELEGRGVAWTEERGTSDEGRRRLKRPGGEREKLREQMRPGGYPPPGCIDLIWLVTDWLNWCWHACCADSVLAPLRQFE
jgi:hypothetical protein